MNYTDLRRRKSKTLLRRDGKIAQCPQIPIGSPALGRAVGIPDANIFVGENGLPLDLNSNEARYAKPVQAGMVLVDGLEISGPDNAALRDRSDLSRDGVVFLAVTVSSQDGETIAPAEIVLRGVPLSEPEDDLIKAMRDAIEDSLDRAFEDEVHEVTALENLIKDDLQAFLFKRIKRRPIMLPVVVEV